MACSVLIGVSMVPAKKVMLVGLRNNGASAHVIRMLRSSCGDIPTTQSVKVSCMNEMDSGIKTALSPSPLGITLT